MDPAQSSHLSFKDFLKNLIERQFTQHNCNGVVPSESKKMIDGVPNAPPPTPTEVIFKNNVAYYQQNALNMNSRGTVRMASLGHSFVFTLNEGSNDVQDPEETQNALEVPQQNNRSGERASDMPAFDELRRLSNPNTLLYRYENGAWVLNDNANIERQEPNGLFSLEKHISRIYVLLGIVVMTMVIAVIYLFPKNKGK